MTTASKEARTLILEAMGNPFSPDDDEIIRRSDAEGRVDYYIDYQTGAGNEEFRGTLAEAEAEADDGASYTQQNILIYDGKPRFDEKHRLVAKREWCGCMDGFDDQILPIRFGDWGYYGDWEEM